MGPVLVLGLGLQIADLHSIMQSVGLTVNATRVEPEEVTAIRSQLAGKANMVVLPMWACDPDGTPTGNRNTDTFEFLALEMGMTLNNVSV
jgi:hypothetical protein